MKLDPLLISRLQFAFTIKFQIIFPTFTIGLNEAPRYLIRARTVANLSTSLM
jgi:cytochrome bd-type quinol oxidase subunit 1